MNQPPNRRGEDLIEARLVNVFRQELGETRHMLRDEMAANAFGLREELTSLNKSTSEQINAFAKLEVKLSDLAVDVAELRALEPRVRQLEAVLAGISRLGEAKRWFVGAFLALAAVVVGAAAAVIAALQ